jgi:hypothetical protein
VFYLLYITDALLGRLIDFLVGWLSVCIYIYKLCMTKMAIITEHVIYPQYLIILISFTFSYLSTNVNLYLQSMVSMHLCILLFFCFYLHACMIILGGLVLCSKSKEVESSLRQIFHDRLISKRYVAIVSRKLLPLKGEISFPLDQKPSLTRYSVVSHTRSGSYGEWISTVTLHPVTGRTHQLRRHLKYIGHPIIGED